MARSLRSSLRLSVLLLLTCVAACAGETPLPDTAVMPAGALGTNGDIDTRSLDVAAFDFANRMQGQPARVADAVAALDYMGGKLTTSPRWIDAPPLVADNLLRARQTVRLRIGISPTAPSQAVVDTMLALSQAYTAQDQSAVRMLLANPIFVAPPDQVAAQLADFPRIATVNAATTRADGVGFDDNVPG